MPLASTQKFLEIDQIREGIIILKNKALRGILVVSSLNFALRSEAERNAIINQFQNFLNSLDFSIQIICQSRKLNITGYLEKVKRIEELEENELLKIQIADYRKFIESYVEIEAIMRKNFFIVVPFTILEVTGAEKKGGLLGKPLPVLTEELFQRCKIQLRERMEFLVLGLKRCGLLAIPLTTPELIELFWGHHHPKDAEFGYFPEIPPELTL